MTFAPPAALTLLLANLVPTGAFAAESVELAAPPASVPQRLVMQDDPYDRMTVPVTIGGSGPFHFLVDTGAEQTVISRELADALQLKRGRAAKVVGIASRKLVETALVPKLGLGGLRSSNLRAPMLAQDDIGAHGLLGVDTLHRNRVLFDFKKRSMTILPPRGPVGAELDGDTIIVRARERSGRLILTDASADGQKVRGVIDTGAETSIGNLALRDRLIGQGRRSPDMVMIRSAAGELVELETFRLRRMTIGSLQLGDVVLAFADSPAFRSIGLGDRPAILLGMNVLRAFDRVAIDFPAKRLHFDLPASRMVDLGFHRPGEAGLQER